MLTVGRASMLIALVTLGCGGNAFSSTGNGGSAATANGGASNAGSMDDAGSAMSTGGDSSGSGGSSNGMGGSTSGAGAGPRPMGCTDAAECNDSNPCTDDYCGADGQCMHPNVAGACADDADDCTDDVCSGGLCTHPANGSCSCSAAADCDDSNPCTDDDCDANGDCVYADNEDPCPDDGNACTDDQCLGGQCMHTNHTRVCSDDGLMCTLDVCDQGLCTHPVTGSCPRPFKLRTNQLTMDVGPSFVNISEEQGTAGYLIWGATEENAEIFVLHYTQGTQAYLQATSTGKYLALAENDYLAALATEETAGLFDTGPCGTINSVGAACGQNCRTLQALGDDDAEPFASADNVCPENGGHCVINGLRARNPTCNDASEYSWEAFEFVFQDDSQSL